MERRLRYHFVVPSHVLLGRYLLLCFPSSISMNIVLSHPDNHLNIFDVGTVVVRTEHTRTTSSQATSHDSFLPFQAHTGTDHE
jgi:hypothetical protein